VNRSLTVFLLLFLHLARGVSPPSAAAAFRPSDDDVRFLDEVERKAFDYFLREHHPRTGLVKDKASNSGTDANVIASIAATGFGLAAVCVGAERGWISRDDARAYCLKTLRTFRDRMEPVQGFFYHFVHWETGKRTKDTELSSIDTALFLAGALTAARYFEGSEVETLAEELYARVDFRWMLAGDETLAMGWHPDGGFLKSRWDRYNESFILYLLAVASPTHPIPADSWAKVKKPVGRYGPQVFIYSGPLFTHQYSHIWVDFREKNDGFADYFENSRIATLANRQFTLDRRHMFKTYSEDFWGLTASLGPAGYRAYGAGPGGAVHDGTVAPTAAGSAVVFTPELSIRAIRAMRDRLGGRLWGKYGFGDAFNLDRDWVAQEVLGIDQGPLLLMIENFRSELLWRIFMRDPRMTQAMERMGFRPGALAFRLAKRPLIRIPRAATAMHVDGNLSEWNFSFPLRLEAPAHHEVGSFQGKDDAVADLYFAWDPSVFYMASRVRDNSLVASRKGPKIWRDDCLELFFDPRGQGLKWGSRVDLQMGFSPGQSLEPGRAWAWFRDLDPLELGGVRLHIVKHPDGYDFEASIPWRFLQIVPRSGRSFGFTPAFHDADSDGSEGKLTWYFLPDGKTETFLLGEAVLE
jgi:hypothetical protein